MCKSPRAEFRPDLRWLNLRIIFLYGNSTTKRDRSLEFSVNDSPIKASLDSKAQDSMTITF